MVSLEAVPNSSNRLQVLQADIVLDKRRRYVERGENA